MEIYNENARSFSISTAFQYKDYTTNEYPGYDSITTVVGDMEFDVLFLYGIPLETVESDLLVRIEQRNLINEKMIQIARLTA